MPESDKLEVYQHELILTDLGKQDLFEVAHMRDDQVVQLNIITFRLLY